jgi:hypothetical protein
MHRDGAGAFFVATRVASADALPVVTSLAPDEKEIPLGHFVPVRYGLTVRAACTSAASSNCKNPHRSVHFGMQPLAVGHALRLALCVLQLGRNL